MKTNKSTASKSTELTDAPESIVSTIKPQIIMQPDNSINSTPTINAVNSDNTVNSTTPANTDNLFDNEQTATEPTAVADTTEQPKQQRVGKQQRKSDYADFKATYLTPAKLEKRLSTSRTAYGRSSNASPASLETVTPPSAATSTPSSWSISISMPTTSKYGVNSEMIMSGYHCTRYTVGQLPDERSELGRQGYVSGFLFLRKRLPKLRSLSRSLPPQST